MSVPFGAWASWWIAIPTAIVAAAAAFAASLFLNLHERPFLLPMIAVMVCALKGGFVSGLTAGITTVALANYYLVEPREVFRIPTLSDAYQLIVFAVTAGVIALLASRQRRAELRLRQQSEERRILLAREHEARIEAERANRVKDDFLATLSHELRTPLNAVVGWAQMLVTREMPPEQRHRAYESILRNAHAQARLVEDVLDLSRIATGRLTMAAVKVDLSEIVRTTADAFTPAVMGKHQRITLDLTPRVMVLGDPHRLRQVAWNLISNATKFTPDGGVVTVRTKGSGPNAELAIEDTGAGIDPAFLPHVFDRFRQADSSSTRAHGGLGLGLALVRHLVEAHGGAVSVHSDGIGKGTIVRVTLPLQA